MKKMVVLVLSICLFSMLISGIFTPYTSDAYALFKNQVGDNSQKIKDTGGGQNSKRLQAAADAAGNGGNRTLCGAGAHENGSPPRGPIPGIDSSTPYCFYYGKWDNCVIKEIKEKFKLVILHPGIEEPSIIKGQVEELQDANIIVIGYITFGEDYQKREQVNGLHPRHFDDQNCRLIAECNEEKKRYASWYVDVYDEANKQKGHDCEPDKNPNFGTYYVNAGDPNWQAFVRSASIESDQFAGTDYILNDLGCDGLFIDCIETATPWGNYSYTWRGMFDLVCKTSALYPEKYILVNRPLFACCLDSYPMTCCPNASERCSAFCFCDISSQRAARDAFRRSINGLVWESYSLDKDSPYCGNIRDMVIKCSDNSDGMGFTVFVLDYYSLIKGFYPDICDQVGEVRGMKWLDYIAPGPLDEIGYRVYCCAHPDACDCRILIDGDCKDWEDVSSCITDLEGDISRPNADIVKACITHNQENLFFYIQLDGIVPDGFYDPDHPDEYNFYQIFIDVAGSTQGYQGPGCAWMCGAEYFWENGTLWRYTGSGCDWAWEQTAAKSSYAIGKRARDKEGGNACGDDNNDNGDDDRCGDRNVKGNDDDEGVGGCEDEGGEADGEVSFIEVGLPRCDIGAKGLRDKTIRVLFSVNAYDIGESDFAPDAASENCYSYSYLCDGDFDCDGDVDVFDLGVFARDFGRTDCATTCGCGGDLDCDGDVDVFDLGVFAREFGRTDCPRK